LVQSDTRPSVIVTGVIDHFITMGIPGHVDTISNVIITGVIGQSIGTT